LKKPKSTAVSKAEKWLKSKDTTENPMKNKHLLAARVGNEVFIARFEGFAEDAWEKLEKVARRPGVVALGVVSVDKWPKSIKVGEFIRAGQQRLNTAKRVASERNTAVAGFDAEFLGKKTANPIGGKMQRGSFGEFHRLLKKGQPHADRAHAVLSALASQLGVYKRVKVYKTNENKVIDKLAQLEKRYEGKKLGGGGPQRNPLNKTEAAQIFKWAKNDLRQAKNSPGYKPLRDRLVQQGHTEAFIAQQFSGKGIKKQSQRIAAKLLEFEDTIENPANKEFRYPLPERGFGAMVNPPAEETAGELYKRLRKEGEGAREAAETVLALLVPISDGWDKEVLDRAIKTVVAKFEVDR